MAQFEPDLATAREDLCRFLAACYYEPSAEFAAERVFDSMFEAASRIGPEFAEAARKLGDAFAAQDLQALLVDYTRLFLGPVQPLAVPYGAYWLSGEASVLQDSTLEVQALYGEGGFEVDEELHELPDHVAVELEFLYLLIFKANEAQRAGLTEVHAAWQHLRRLFLGQHLGVWIQRFAAAVQSGAQTAFYRELAGLTERFVRMESASAGAAT